MNRNIIIAALSLGVASIATYILLRRRSSNEIENAVPEVKKARHLTNAFSKAKQRAINH